MNKDQIKNLVKELIEKTTVKLNKISITEEAPSTTWFSVEVEEPHFFISRDAEALHALNHIIRRILENKNPAPKLPPNSERNFGESVLVDINGFQRKRVEDVRAVAHMMSERARYFKANIEVNPMSSFERRIVHEFLADAIDLKTESTGFGNSRRVIIKYIGGI